MAVEKGNEMTEMGRAVREFRRAWAQHEERRALNEARQYLGNLLSPGPWIGLPGGQRCQSCWELYPNHRVSCDWVAAVAYLGKMK